MKKLLGIAGIILFVTASSFAGMESDLQAGFSFASQREAYTESSTSFSNSTNRTGIELANYNIFNDTCFGFFEDINFEFYRFGSSRSGGESHDYDDDSFFAFEFLAGPVIQITSGHETVTRIGVGLHYINQSWSADSYTYDDTNIGIGIVVDSKLFRYERFSLILGVKAFYDPQNSKTYEKNDYSYSVTTSDYSLIGVEPHILFCINLN